MQASPKAFKREVKIAFDNHFEVTLGGILAAKGGAGAAKVALEAAKFCQGDCQGRLGLEKACSRGPKDVQREPGVSIVTISGFKVTSKRPPNELPEGVVLMIFPGNPKK